MPPAAESAALILIVDDEENNRALPASSAIALHHQPQEVGGEIVMRVEDSGNGLDFAAVEQQLRSPRDYHGRGIPLVRSLSQTLDHPGRGNCAEARYRWS